MACATENTAAQATCTAEMSKEEARKAKNRLNARLWAQKHPERNRQRVREWYRANKDRALTTSKAWKAANPDKVKSSNAASHARRYRIRTYGITPEQFKELLLQQGHACKVCGRRIEADTKVAGRINAAQVDHDHTTGRVRGLLCVYCNTAIGKLNDSPELLEKAAAYLRENT